VLSRVHALLDGRWWCGGFYEDATRTNVSIPFLPSLSTKDKRTWCVSKVKELEAKTMEHGKFRCKSDGDEGHEVQSEEGGVGVVASVVGRYEEAASANRSASSRG
jgi:hypothetical protein